MESKKTILELNKVSMHFGGLTAVDELSLDVKEGEIVGLIGPNGAGKTTVFNCVTQFYKEYTGDIYFQNHDGDQVDLRDYKVTDIAKLGLIRTFQNVELVKDLSILDNLLIGAHHHYETGIIQHILHTKKARSEEKRMKEKAYEILKFLKIYEIKDFYVAGQPYGILKKIEIARTLMSDPKLIILDEPAAGLNDQETDELETLIHQIRENYHTTILLIEHDMGFVMNICDRVCAINFGKFLAMDIPKNIQKNPSVQEAYLGKDE
ncbi:MAG: ABC transporter ATP-binding protein [Candidatus Izemoplasmataceae bacterium]|uniref:Branched-chain amino acid ABC transporter ATPase n=1 Tax=Firmicutes bacterium enrichment culture clone fosmid MGS-M2 TaxID=1549349 RepID=A0A0B5KUC9_9FIRM|nr:branched-chain amino acid ABC transporter ATPase [Firmicutes bacterium enrichment culture clone fosmid MGS-M2]